MTQTDWNVPCPQCNKDRFYSRKAGMERALRAKNLCPSCRQLGSRNHQFGTTRSPESMAKRTANLTEAHREQARQQLSLVRNRRPYYEIWVEKHGVEEADRRNVDLNRRRSERTSGARNPMHGKPSPQGGGNGWSGWYRDSFFRSLRELAFMVTVLDEGGLKWRSAECRNLQIEYKDVAGRVRSYYADFLVEDRTLVEVKPYKLWSSPTVSLKSQAAVKFCRINSLSFCLIDLPLLEYNSMNQMWLDGRIRWHPRYESRFKEWRIS